MAKKDKEVFVDTTDGVINEQEDIVVADSVPEELVSKKQKNIPTIAEPTTENSQLEKVKIVKEVNFLFLAGKYYSFNVGDLPLVKPAVSHILRSKGFAV